MGDLKPVLEGGAWTCPVCGFKAMSQKVVMAHIMHEHEGKHKDVKPSEKSKPKPQHNSKKSLWIKKKIGTTEVEILKRDHIKITNQSNWFQHFNIHNYLGYLHNKYVRVTLSNGEDYVGTLQARDPFFVQLTLESGRKLLINKGHIITVEELSTKP